MSTIISYLNSLRLSLIQWTCLVLAGAVGALVVAFRAQGSQLHRAQIQLLLATMRQSDTNKEAAVVKAREAFQIAMKDYQDHEGK